MVKKILTSKRGDMYIGAIITLIIVVALLVFCLTTLRVASVKNSADNVADQLLETATFYGCFGTEFEEKVTALKETYSALDFEVTYDGDWYNSTLKRVQLGGNMTVTVSYRVTIGGFGSFLSIPLSTIRVGSSENYWKNT